MCIAGKMRRRRLRDLSIVQNTPNSEKANSEQQTVVGSSNVPETLDEPAEFQIESGGTRRGRGSYLGIISRNANMLPINYESWHHMPYSNKNQALDNIKEIFALEVSDDYIKKALGKNGETIKAV
ncbi:Ribosomal RNA large subunit methyltransferase E [Gossypium arboreum]|uniref:Ribosomal RNA large subunit methyltransferase E n=1 Tax=Gossypium arboreum TaxID=29729 RepID=A0A0B0PQX4_GOSAR|nr:Ribosomal RNA large subunit methyltransferase E [Gossypium arboreum]